MLGADGQILPDTGDPGFGVYLHWPFCAAKCPYCDFNSHVRHQPVDQPRFVEAFLKEMAAARELTGPRTVTSIFIGGGTPSLMQPATVEAILNGVANTWHVPAGIEITLEANPSSVEAERFRGYRAAGVNRVSMGVQALNDKDLKFLGRLHNVEEALTAIRLAREIFPRMSFDLIYARPGQTVEEWQRELVEAINLAVDHLSLYQLTIEEGTPFFGLHKAASLPCPMATSRPRFTRQRRRSPRATACRPMKCPTTPCRVLKAGTISPIGAMATMPGSVPARMAAFHGADRRSRRRPNGTPEAWLSLVEARGHGMIDHELLDSEEQADELLLMGLRLREGVDLARWQALSGRDPDPKREQLLLDHGFIERLGNSRLRCTPSGMLILDSVVADLAC